MSDAFDSAYREGLRPDPRLTVSEWADKFRVLSQTVAAEPGRWRTARTPYARDVMDALSPRHPCQRVVLMKGAQVGGTELGNNWVGYIIGEAPGPMMIVIPTVETAKRWSKQRLARLIEDTPTLRDKVKDSRSRDSGNTVLTKEFEGGIVIVTGANSAVGLRSMPAKYRFFDETDAYPGDVDGEGDPILLAERSGRTFKRGKSFFVSTPGIHGLSPIERLYSEGSRGKYFVPCPHCNESQTIEWPNIHWPKAGDEWKGKELEEDLASEAFLVCIHCGATISEHHKTWMLENGEWRHDRPDHPTLSFHLSSLYSPVGWFSWADAAALFVEAKDSQARLKVFVNTVLGETWQDRGEAPDARRLYDRREEYEINKIPRGGLFLTAGVDVQKDRLELEIVAWGRRFESWSIDYRVLPGDPYGEDVWKDLSDVLNEKFATPYGGRMIPISRLAIDAGYATQSVYHWVRSVGTPQVIAVRGIEKSVVPIGAPKTVDIDYGGRRIARGCRVWSVADSLLKSELYRWLRLDPPLEEEESQDFPVGYCHFPQYPIEFFRQMTAERIVTKVVRGYPRTEWVKHRDRNEALDCRKYARAAGYSLGMDRWTPERWDQIEEDLGANLGESEPDDYGDGSDSGPAPSTPAKKGRRRGKSPFMG